MNLNRIKNLSGVKLSKKLVFFAFGLLFVFSCSEDESKGNSEVKYTLSITKPENGTLSSDVGGINCGSKTDTCEAEFEKDTEVTLTAKADEGYVPGAWSGACASAEAGATCTVEMDTAKTVSKVFSETGETPVTPVTPGTKKYTLTVTKPRNGTITHTGSGINCGGSNTVCEAEFDKGTEVTLTATANKGYVLGAWSGGSCSGLDTTCTLTMDTDKMGITKTFTITRHTLTVTKPAGGNITSDVGDINCGSEGTACEASFNYETAVTLTAMADTGSASTDLGYGLGPWDDACASAATAAGCRLNMNTDKTVNKEFYDLDVDDDNDGLIEIHNLDIFYYIKNHPDGGTGTLYAYTYDSNSSDTSGAPTSVTVNCTTDADGDGFYLCGYELMRDLDFAEGASYASSSVNTSWQPNNSDASMATNAGFVGATDFAGIFEGNGYKISNLYSRNIVDARDNIGLFNSTTADATIRNLGVEDAHLYGNAQADKIGALVGYNNQGSISASYASGTNANGGGGTNNYVGGLVGHNNQGSISASYATGAVNGGTTHGDYTGGLVGKTDGGSIIACYATATANAGAGTYDYVGGLVGNNGGSIIASYATGAVNGGDGDGDYTGGLVGSNVGSIVASYATGAVNGDAGSDDLVGALVGHVGVGSNIVASYGFGDTTMGTVNGDGAPGGLTINGLTATGGSAGLEWNQTASKTKDAWDFGNNTQAPALQYADYDGDMAGIDYCALFPAKIPGTDDTLFCGTASASLLPGQRP